MAQGFIALLRGVNVGKGRRVPMATLREVLAGLGYADVATLLNSGNAVFRASAKAPRPHARRIALALREALGIEVPVIVKTAQELDAIVADNPISGRDLDHSRLLVMFAQESGELAPLAPLAELIEPPEQFAIGREAAYLYCANGILQSKAADAQLGKGAATITTRNLATTLKLQALARAGKSG